jgi:hypothetical protein
MNEEIIAYRIGEDLFCPDCYEKKSTALKAVQNPNEPQVTFPAKAIKKGDIKIFICCDCKEIKTSSEMKEPLSVKIPSIVNVIKISSEEGSNPPVKEKRKTLGEFLDKVDESKCKLAFLRDFVTHNVPNDELFSKNGIIGLYFILSEIEDNVDSVSNGIRQSHERGLIIEKEVS